ncbi:hypothetical protein [Fusobacterium sp.]|uniref:hypothetical protein n=1 Tax=Fusobacterium sp. TaxID=68766 RepID=UPI0025BDCD40|nr:hypothetical protein [Fusobacterium sp.]
MKKILIGLFLIISALGVADDKYDYVEDKLELKYGILSDFQQNKLKLDDIDVGIFRDKIYVKLEVESLIGDGGWKEFNKKEYDRLATEIADNTREMLGVGDPVEVTLVLDREIGEKEVLSTGIY